MANSKRELEYDIAIQTIVYFTQAWNGQLKPSQANPYCDIDRIKTPEQREEEAKEGWAILKTGLQLFSTGRVNN